MTLELIEEGVVCLLILGGYLVALGIGCPIADFVFPHIPLIERYLESLPDWEDEDERSESMSSIKVTMDVQTLRSIMGDTFDYDAFSQGRKDCYKLAMKSSYDEFAAKLEEVKKYIEYESHHHVAPGPSYWLGCLCQFGDSTVWPEKEVRGDEGSVLGPVVLLVQSRAGRGQADASEGNAGEPPAVRGQGPEAVG